MFTDDTFILETKASNMASLLNPVALIIFPLQTCLVRVIKTDK